MKTRIALVAIICILTSCGNGSNTAIPTKEQYKVYLEELGPHKDSLGFIIVEHLKLIDGKVVLDVDRDCFVDLGLPSIAYDVALYEVHQMNTVLDGLDKETRDQIEPQLIEQIQLLSEK